MKSRIELRLPILLLLALLIVSACALSGCGYQRATLMLTSVSRYEPLDASREFNSTIESKTSARRFSSSGSGFGQHAPIAKPGDVSSEYLYDEEIWVITRYQNAGKTVARDDQPGTGGLVTHIEDKRGETRQVAVPLKHTDVKAQVRGYIATVDVQQQFHNPYDGKIEAVYVFPLPQNAAVNEFVMTIGKRKIRGIIRDRKEAEEIYQHARSQGFTASLMTQQRPNIFTQKVANIEPGKRIDIDIRYFHTLAYRDGWYEFVFPMVVGPRFNPPATAASGSGVGAVARGAHGQSAQKTEVQYLRPTERSGHDISLSVDINAGVPIENIRSVNHRVISQARPTAAVAKGRIVPAGQDGAAHVAGAYHIELADNDRIPNKDFVLRYQVAGKTVRSKLAVHEDERGKFFSLMIYPPQAQSDSDRAKLDLPQKRQPMEMIFVLDCSGSMSGKPMAQARTAVEAALDKLQPGDSLQIIRFSNEASHCGTRPVEATAKNIKRGVRYVRNLQAGGGTHMLTGIRAALDFPHDPGRYRVVTFLTDGYIGNDFEALGAVHKHLKQARIFSFGVGSSPNRFLMNRMAKLGRGAVAYLSLNDNAAVVMDTYFQRISRPVVTDLQIDFGDMDVYDVYPRRTPDLLPGRPVLLTGRFRGSTSRPIRVTGRAGDRQVRFAVSTFDAERRGQSALVSVWARRQIAELVDQQVHTLDPQRELAGEIRRVALEYGLMSAYTAFVAVDSQTRTKGDHGTTVPVPVPVPDGARYETTVDHGRPDRP